MSSKLQSDNREKTEEISRLQDENMDLKNELDIIDRNLQLEGHHAEGLQQVKIQGLNDEIEYLKKHYQVELDVIRQENQLLRKKVAAVTAQNQELDKSLDDQIFGQ